MAGNANDITSRPWPYSRTLWLQFAPVDVQASKTNHVWSTIRVPYGFTPKSVAWTAEAVVEAATGITFDVFDDEGTPNVIVNDEGLSTVTSGIAATWNTGTIDDTGPVLSGAKVSCRYTSDSGCTTRHLQVWLEVEPLYHKSGRDG